jgi:hypothetical protein
MFAESSVKRSGEKSSARISSGEMPVDVSVGVAGPVSVSWAVSPLQAAAQSRNSTDATDTARKRMSITPSKSVVT